jgi:hypothetical protein
MKPKNKGDQLVAFIFVSYRTRDRKQVSGFAKSKPGRPYIFVTFSA